MINYTKAQNIGGRFAFNLEESKKIVMGKQTVMSSVALGNKESLTRTVFSPSDLEQDVT